LRADPIEQRKTGQNVIMDESATISRIALFVVVALTP